jgi:hypothetical protein
MTPEIGLDTLDKRSTIDVAIEILAKLLRESGEPAS